MIDQTDTMIMNGLHCKKNLIDNKYDYFLNFDNTKRQQLVCNREELLSNERNSIIYIHF